MSAANTDFAPPAGAVMMVTVPALTASGLGNAHRVVSGVNTGSDVPDGGWAAGPVGQPHHAATGRLRRPQALSTPMIS
jgi:hypothetical protein